jgi:hypothetical protein
MSVCHFAGYISEAARKLLEEASNAYEIIVRKTASEKSLGRPWHRWEGTIKMDFKGIECGLDLTG